MTEQIHPLDFFSHLAWLDGTPLLRTMQPYRRKLFSDGLYTFDESGRRQYNMVVSGRGKKNDKTLDLVLAGLYSLVAWVDPRGNDSFIVANDEGQAADDLSLAKKEIAVNPILQDELDVQAKSIVRRDGKGALTILPANDVKGSHGKTYCFLGFDEIHAYRSYDLMEALAPDPNRPDVMIWITSYASVYNSPGYPLFDLCQSGKAGTDPRLLFSWYSADFCTDPHFADLPPEQRANPSMAAWGQPDYLAQQRRRLPVHKYRRLHLNLPGMPDGAYFDPGKVADAIVPRRRQLPPVREINGGAVSPVFFADMSGGSRDSAVLGGALFDTRIQKHVLLTLQSQTGPAPFDPLKAVGKFAAVIKQYNASKVYGDQYAGRTFESAFAREGISYIPSPMTRTQLYEAFDPLLNSGQVELLDIAEMHEQLLGLVSRSGKIDHLPGEHDDWANAAAGAIAMSARHASAPAWTVEQIEQSVGRSDIFEEGPADSYFNGGGVNPSLPKPWDL